MAKKLSDGELDRLSGYIKDMIYQNESDSYHENGGKGPFPTSCMFTD